MKKTKKTAARYDWGLTFTMELTNFFLFYNEILKRELRAIKNPVALSSLLHEIVEFILRSIKHYTRTQTHLLQHSYWASTTGTKISRLWHVLRARLYQNGVDKHIKVYTRSGWLSCVFFTFCSAIPPKHYKWTIFILSIFSVVFCQNVYTHRHTPNQQKQFWWFIRSNLYSLVLSNLFTDFDFFSLWFSTRA